MGTQHQEKGLDSKGDDDTDNIHPKNWSGVGGWGRAGPAPKRDQGSAGEGGSGQAIPRALEGSPWEPQAPAWPTHFPEAVMHLTPSPGPGGRAERRTWPHCRAEVMARGWGALTAPSDNKPHGLSATSRTSVGSGASPSPSPLAGHESIPKAQCRRRNNCPQAGKSRLQAAGREVAVAGETHAGSTPLPRAAVSRAPGDATSPRDPGMEAGRMPARVGGAPPGLGASRPRTRAARGPTARRTQIAPGMRWP